MTPAMIIQDAIAEGISITVSPAGKIKATGNGATLNRWLPTIRENKVKILAELQQETQREARRQKVLTILEKNPEVPRAVYTDVVSDPNSVILTIAVRHAGICEMLIPKAKYDPWQLIAILENTSVLH